MAEQITQYKCPACDGVLAFDAATGKMKCEFCDSLYELEEIKAMYADKNKETVEKSAGASSSSDFWGTAADGMKGYSCEMCGAELMCDETTAATSCPYCGNTAIMPQQFTDMERPKYVIPFMVPKDQAKGKLKEYYKGKKLLPDAFSDENHVDEIKGVYVPFWLYSGTVDADMTFTAEKDEVKKTTTEKITTTKHYTVHRKGQIDFDKIPTDASSSMPDDLMDSIEPYDYKDLKNFEMEYLPGYLADKYDVSKEENRKRARERVVGSAESVVQNTISGYDRFSEKREVRNMNYLKEKEEYAMLPVWLLSTHWNEQNFLFAINGQTGKMTGNLPIDKKKQVTNVLITMLIAFVICFGLFFVIQGTNAIASGPIFMSILFTVIAGFVRNGSLVAQMRPVNKKTQANNYLATNDDAKGSKYGNIRLSIKEDTFVRNTVKREKLQN